MTVADLNPSDWNEYRRLVLSELERIGRDFNSINRKIDELRQDDISQLKTDITLLKFQAAMWGSIGGLIFSTIIPFALRLLK